MGRIDKFMSTDGLRMQTPVISIPFFCMDCFDIREFQVVAHVSRVARQQSEVRILRLLNAARKA